jgi:O-antigen ligase
MTRFARSPSLPLAVLLAITPTLAAAQFRAMALAVSVGLVLVIAAHWRERRALPLPRLSAPFLLALALCGWAAVSALWAPDAGRALGTAAMLGALVLLAGAAARAIAEDAPEHRARIAPCIAWGLAAGILLLGFDQASDNLFRRAVRGFIPPSPTLAAGLKPAVSVLALLLPLTLAMPGLKAWARAALLAGGVAVALWLPGESAKIAVLLGLGAAFLAGLAPHLVARAAAAGIALAFLAAPLIFGAIGARAPDLSPLPLTAQHRVLIWDFTVDRIAEAPVIGWGMEAARAIPGGTEVFDRATLDRFGLDSQRERDWFARPVSQRLPLHTHNAALQVWLELGLVGALLAAALAGATLLAAGATTLPAAALGAAVAGAVTGQLSFGVWQPWWIASMLLAAVAIVGLRR